MLISDVAAGGLLVGNSLYYVVRGTGNGPETLFSVSAGSAGAVSTVLATLPVPLDGPYNVVDGFAYFAAPTGQVSRVALPGGTLQPVTTVPTDGDGIPATFFVGGGFVFFSNGEEVLRAPVTGGGPQVIVSEAAVQAGSTSAVIAVGGSPLELFVVGDSSVQAYALDGTAMGTVLDSMGGTFGIPSFVGTRLFVADVCPDAPSIPVTSFTPYYDTATASTGVLENEPGYPFVPGPPSIDLNQQFGGMLRDPSGTHIYTVVVAENGG